MKRRAVFLGLLIAMSWWLSPPLWAEINKPAKPVTEQQYQNVTEELMIMLKETMGILSNLDHAPSAEEKKHLMKMMTRLDDMLKQQQTMTQDLKDQLDDIRQQQDEYFRRERIIEQQNYLPK